MSAKYQKGDRVRVLWHHQSHNWLFYNDYMDRYIGRTGHISAVFEHRDGNVSYEIEEFGDWSWAEDWIEVAVVDDIDTIVNNFVREKLAIDYSDAQYDEMVQLDKVLSEKTIKRPHDGETFLQHMLHYLPERYVYLVCEGNTVSSYRDRVKDCRPEIITVSEVLGAAGIRIEPKFSEEDFDSTFQ